MLKFIAIAIVIKPTVSIAPKFEAITANIQEIAVTTRWMSERSKLPGR